MVASTCQLQDAVVAYKQNCMLSVASYHNITIVWVFMYVLRFKALVVEESRAAVASAVSADKLHSVPAALLSIEPVTRAAPEDT